MVRALFSLVQLYFHSSLTALKEIPFSKQESVKKQEKVKSSESKKEEASSTDENDEDGIYWIFQQEESEEDQKGKSQKKEVKDEPVCSLAFDILLRIVFKIEEALFLQCKSYEQEVSPINRNYSSFSRLFSFLNLSFPTAIPIEKLLDMGIYLKSSYLNEFYYYQCHDFPTEDWSKNRHLQKCSHSQF